MLRSLIKRITRRTMIVSPRSYEKQLRRYRIEHPESLEKDNEQVQQWIAFVEARRRAEQKGNREVQFEVKDVRLAYALYELREVARTAFMSHPAATEYDFRRCWPSIREELLKQHALEELAANPALSQSLAIQISEANAEAEQESRGGNLQLLK